MTEAKTTTARAKKAEEPSLNIYQRIAAISREAGALAPEAKGGVPFAFRGIDGTVAHLDPFLNKYEVIAVPELMEHTVSEREIINPTTGNPNGKLVKTTQVVVKYRFFGPDGDSVEATTAGLADDFGDRSTAQAMSVALRIALLQTFHLPTHSKEPEESGQEVMNARDGAGQGAPAAPKAVATAQAKAVAAVPAGNVVKLQSEAKALGKALGKQPADLNALMAEHAGESKDPFNDPKVMTDVVAALEAEQKAAEAAA